ncbi:CpsD/CapB family tyrosine-protein kinase [Anaeromyxobacter paludicola]|uniref:Tyrosine protein kinase n=1 Tax=Anaeromyxobacter paludicola TaxID=2918171 RepID=A0ABM7X8M5_9BACT|nr:CpsD/CapB family tyrosine-protein kinase [Anaeromyxobacter paludicola]BDG08195.1 tyrosine protein kinase [Anaeromyxobacter paludicola]
MSIPAETLGIRPAVRPDAVGGVTTLAPSDSAAAEQYRALQHRLERLAARRPMRVVAITSSARGEGRTTTALNLALTAAEDGREVALVECDLRKPCLAQRLDLAPRAGLAEVALGTAELSQALCRVGGLSVLCAGEVKDPGAVLRSPRLRAVIDALRQSCGLVILDAPPALAFADAERLASAADGAVLVVRAQETPREVVRLALDTLGDRAVGIVLNRVNAGALPHGKYLYADPTAA